MSYIVLFYCSFIYMVIGLYTVIPLIICFKKKKSIQAPRYRKNIRLSVNIVYTGNSCCLMHRWLSLHSVYLHNRNLNLAFKLPILFM